MALWKRSRDAKDTLDIKEKLIKFRPKNIVVPHSYTQVGF